MPQRRKRIIPGLAQKMSGEARRVSLLTHALHEMRLALNRLSKELLVWVAMLICLWQLLWDLFARLLRVLF